MAKRISRISVESVSALAGAMRQQVGGFTHAEIRERVKGIYIPDYAERWVRDSNVYLLGRMEMHVGKFGSGKSTQLMREGRAFLEAGGIFAYVETEGKFSAAFAEATLGAHVNNPNYIPILANSMGALEKKAAKKGRTRTEEDLDQEMEERLGWFTHVYRLIRMVKESKFPDVPMLIAVDTITSATTEEHKKAYYDEEGRMPAATTMQLRRAAVIKRWLEATYDEIKDTNILIAFANHVSDEVSVDGTPRFGKPETKWSGGAALGARASTILEYARGGSERELETQGRSIKVTVRKSSNGTEERSIKVNFDYRFLVGEDGEPVKDEEGNNVRIVNWQWYLATVDVLSRFFNPDHNPEYERMGPASYRDQVRLTVAGQGGDKRYTLRAYNPKNLSELLWEIVDVDGAALSQFVETSYEAQQTLQNLILTNVVNHSTFNYLEEIPEDEPAAV